MAGRGVYGASLAVSVVTWCVVFWGPSRSTAVDVLVLVALILAAMGMLYASVWVHVAPVRRKGRQEDADA